MVEAIATVFRRFDEFGSARQVLLSLLEDGLQLPPAPLHQGTGAVGQADLTARSTIC